MLCDAEATFTTIKSKDHFLPVCFYFSSTADGRVIAEHMWTRKSHWLYHHCQWLHWSGCYTQDWAPAGPIWLYFPALMLWKYLLATGLILRSTVGKLCSSLLVRDLDRFWGKIIANIPNYWASIVRSKTLSICLIVNSIVVEWNHQVLKIYIYYFIIYLKHGRPPW